MFKRPVITLVWTLMGLGALLSACAGQGQASLTPTPAPAATSASSAPLRNPPAVFYPPIVLGDAQWRLIEALDAGNTLDATLQTQGEFIWVRLAIQNLSTGAPLAFQAASISVADTAGQRYPIATEATARMAPEQERCFDQQQLAPQTSKICQIYFDLPQGAERLKLVLSNLNPGQPQERLVELTPFLYPPVKGH